MGGRADGQTGRRSGANQSRVDGRSATDTHHRTSTNTRIPHDIERLVSHVVSLLCFRMDDPASKCSRRQNVSPHVAHVSMTRSEVSERRCGVVGAVVAGEPSWELAPRPATSTVNSLRCLFSFCNLGHDTRSELQVRASGDSQLTELFLATSHQDETARQSVRLHSNELVSICPSGCLPNKCRLRSSSRCLQRRSHRFCCPCGRGPSRMCRSLQDAAPSHLPMSRSLRRARWPAEDP